MSSAVWRFGIQPAPLTTQIPEPSPARTHIRTAMPVSSVRVFYICNEMHLLVNQRDENNHALIAHDAPGTRARSHTCALQHFNGII